MGLFNKLLLDDETREILVTLIIDSGVLFAAYLFVQFSKKRGSRNAEDKMEKVNLVTRNSDPLYESAKSNGQVRTPPRFQFQSVDGMLLGTCLAGFAPLGGHLREAALYLRFHALACSFFLILSMVGLTVLAPVYANGPGNIYSVYELSIVERFTASNVTVASMRLLVSFLAIVVFAGFAWVVVRQYYGDIVQMVQVWKKGRRGEESNDVSAHTILLTQLPTDLRDEQLLLGHLKATFGARVLACRIATGAGKGLSSGTRGSRGLGLNPEESRVKGHRRSRPNPSNRGSAFACFAAPMYAREAVDLYSGSSVGRARLNRMKGPRRTLKGRRRLGNVLLKDSEWRAEAAPSPSDIVWDNLAVGNSERGFRGIVINACLFTLMTMIIAPVAVIDRLEPLVTSLEDAALPDKLQHREVRRFVGSYFPTLVVFVINSILLPFLIEISSQYEGHKTESARSAAVVRRNAVFQFINTILLPSLALNSAAAAIRLAYETDFSEWEKIIGNSLQKHTSARFFLIYLIHATMLGCASELARLPQRTLNAFTQIKQCILGSEGLGSDVDRPWEFDFGYFYGARLTMMGLVLLYSVLVPIIVPFGAIYFLFNYWTDGHNLRSGVYTISFDSNGALPLSILRYVLWYVTLFLFTMSCYFTVQGTLMFFVLGMMLLMLGAVSLCCTMLPWRPDPSELEEDFTDGLNNSNGNKLCMGRRKEAEEELSPHVDTEEAKGKKIEDFATSAASKNPARDRTIMYEFLRSYVCPFQVPVVSVLQDPSSDSMRLVDEEA
eukprot:CAMPEP_0184501752 /NCGR_PEP_ID=MMETSP0113_2-20130426/48471_1 /TAXON_ID=91329 /ORGANISM="Norrisiella sphaerica, Strain BC52" /LENGTH=778 /DNA_ID=CAMNT_0026890629 /DNA_START=259 /DNA_END=2595 /DNA_ORIENTATION=-